MATKSKLEQAVEKRAASLNEAQREIVLSQLSVYKQNSARLAKISDELVAVNARTTVTRDEVRMKQSDRASLAYEQNQLSIANSKIAFDLFNFMEED